MGRGTGHKESDSWRLKPKRKHKVSKAAGRLMRCSVAMAIVLAATLAAGEALHRLSQTFAPCAAMRSQTYASMAAALAMAFTIAALVATHVKGWLYRGSDKRFLTVTCITAGTIAIASICLFEQKWVSDFARMHVAAATASAYNVRELVSCIPDVVDAYRPLMDLPAERLATYDCAIYLRRVLFYAYPIYHLLGVKPFFVELANVAIHLATALGVFWLSQRAFRDPRISRLATVLFLMIPVRYTMLNLLSHDVIGTFYLVALACAVSELTVRLVNGAPTVQCLLWSLLLSATAIATGIQRNLWPLIEISLIVFTVWMHLRSCAMPGKRRRARHMLALAAFLLVIPITANHQAVGALWNRIYRPSDNIVPGVSTPWGSLFAWNDIETEASWLRGCEIEVAYLQPMAQGEIHRSYALGRLAFEIGHRPRSYLAFLRRKLQGFLAMGENQSWVTHQSGSLGHTLDAPLLAANRVYRLFLFALLGAGGGAMLTWQRFRSPFMFSLLVLVVFGGILVFFEAQSRYSFVLHPFIATAGAMGLIQGSDCCRRMLRPNHTRKRRTQGLRSLRTAATVAGGMLLAGCLALAICRYVRPHLQAVLLDLNHTQLTLPESANDTVPAEPIPITFEQRPFKYGIRVYDNGKNRTAVKAALDTPVRRHDWYAVTAFLRGPTNGAERLRVTVSLGPTTIADGLLGDFESKGSLTDERYLVFPISSPPLEAATDGAPFMLELATTGTESRSPQHAMDVFLEYVMIRRVSPRPARRQQKR